MKNLKLKLLTATILAVPAVPAHAQFAFPTVEIRGVGASAPADVNVKVQNCIGVNQDLGVNNNTFINVTEADYANTGTPSNGKPSLTCTTDGADGDIYNSINGVNGSTVTTTYTGKYVSTGSGFGRTQWRRFTNQFTGSATSTNPFGTWPNVQYAFSEAPATTSDITTYNTDAAPQAGAAIQFPLYVIPVAFAYNPQYGSNNGTPMNFNVGLPQTTNGVASGGIRLSRAAYCGIWNGTITNWNNSLIQAQNKFGTVVTPLFDPVNDTANRWTTEGVPIRLVGRADTSGTTDIFTRALAAQCAGTKFAQAAESLPYATGGNIDIRGIRSSSTYFPTSTAVFAGTTQSLNGYVYDRTNNRFCLATNDASNEATGGACSAAAAPVSLAQFQTGGASAGLFTVADGSSSVEAAVRRNDGLNAALASGTAGITLNGKLGYIGADFVAGSTGRSLHAAALQQGTSGTYLMPNTKNASTAFGKVLPPQTTATTGAYNPLDTRVVYKDLTNTGLGTETVNRSNPLHWVNVLYPPTGVSLAAPTTGYPFTGASNLLTYTCFNSEAKRFGMANFIGHLLGNIKKKNAKGGTPLSISLSTNTFKGISATETGILTKSNIALPATAWQKAITETFLKGNSTQAGLSALNLWIQSNNPTSLANSAAVTSNPSCAIDGAGSIPGA